MGQDLADASHRLMTAQYDLKAAKDEIAILRGPHEDMILSLKRLWRDEINSRECTRCHSPFMVHAVHTIHPALGECSGFVGITSLDDESSNIIQRDVYYFIQHRSETGWLATPASINCDIETMRKMKEDFQRCAELRIIKNTHIEEVVE